MGLSPHNDHNFSFLLAPLLEVDSNAVGVDCCSSNNKSKDKCNSLSSVPRPRNVCRVTAQPSAELAKRHTAASWKAFSRPQQPQVFAMCTAQLPNTDMTSTSYLVDIASHSRWIHCNSSAFTPRISIGSSCCANQAHTPIPGNRPWGRLSH
jgi:hypothetical protein